MANTRLNQRTLSQRLHDDLAEMIDQAAETQYNLAELYWFSLDKPDTAILELRYIVDSFSTSYLVPKAAIALSGMYKENLNDTLGADSILRQVLADYPRSDFLSEALAALGWLGTEADTGYAQVYMKRAEDALVDNDDYETARENYQYVVDSFPDSRHYLHARFNQIWLEETYASPGDSSILLAYHRSHPSHQVYASAGAQKRTPGKANRARQG